MQMTKKYGFIVDGVLDNVIIADEDFASQHNLVEVPDYVNGEACGRGWLYDGTTFTKPIEEETLVATVTATKEELLLQLNALAEQIQSLT